MPDVRSRSRALLPPIRRAAAVLTAALLAGTLALTVHGAATAYAPRVVIVVGPAGSSTGDYLRHARDYADLAESYGATVVRVFHPHATWKRVLRAAQGANILVYLGHGNGWPSPYGPFQGLTKDGLGLNPYDGAGAGKVKYYGEDFVRKHIRLAPGATVLLNRLCYASGNSEPGRPEPSWKTARKRVDNYAYGFLRAGAKTVIADGHTSLDAEIQALFTREQAMRELWTLDADANDNVREWDSRRLGSARLHLDPDHPDAGFYRSLVTRGTPSTGLIHVAAYWGRAKHRMALRAAPSGDARRVASVHEDARYVVRGALRTDARGRTWARVTTRTGRRGYVAAWRTDFTGSARAATDVVIRARHTTRSARVGRIGEGTRFTVLRGAHDAKHRAWVKVRTANGRTGWVAAWLTRS